MAREQWTQFGDLSMVLGLALFAATLVLHAAAAFGSAPASRNNGRSKQGAAAADAAEGSGGLWAAAGQLVAPWRPGSRLRVPTLRGWLAAMALLHAGGVFSFFYLLSEGQRGWAAISCSRTNARLTALPMHAV